MKQSLVSFAALASLLVTVTAVNLLSVNVASDGSYTVTTPFLTLNSGDSGVQMNGQWVSRVTNGLKVNGITTYNGEDAWGPFNTTEVAYVTTSGNQNVYTNRFRVYTSTPAIIFEQVFPTLITTGNTESSKDNVVSAFPSFQSPGTAAGNIGWMEYSGSFLDRGSQGPSFGLWSTGGLQGFVGGTSGGPMVLFDTTGTNSLVLSAASDFMAGSTVVTGQGEVRVGILGSVASVPSLHSHETVLYFGNGPNNAMMNWGQALLNKYDKPNDGSKKDFTNINLGYNTDHGAYYYYTTANYSDYSQVLGAVYNYSVALGIPYKYVLLDSWWYYKGIGGGVANWTARPDVFEGGAAGVRELVELSNWKITAHNRYWSSDNVYASQNGGKWDFYVDKSGSPAGGQMAVPLEAAFWEWLLTSSVTEWGLTTYEQDWLFNEFLGVDALLTNITLARQWLLQMNLGAEAAGVTIQFCMSFPRHTLQSVEMPAVTQVRASDDHVPCEGYYPLQWRIGLSSMFAWAVAVAPFKDNAWSTSLQPGGSCGNSLEISPALHLAISVFSAGPVTPADGVGYSDASQILRTCTVGGRLLQPSRSMTAIDAQVLGKAFTSTPGFTSGEVYATYSYVSGWTWDHILAGDLNTSFTVYPSNVYGIRGDIPVRMNPDSNDYTQLRYRSLEELFALTYKETDLGMVAYSLNTTSLDLSTLTVQSFGSSNGIPLSACKETDFQVWHTAPVFSNGWALLGELNKWVPVAEARISSIYSSDNEITVELVGEANEVVPVTFYNPSTTKTVTVTCSLNDNGHSTVYMPAGTCQ